MYVRSLLSFLAGAEAQITHSLLELLVDVVDAELLEVVVFEHLEPIDVKYSHREPGGFALYGKVYLRGGFFWVKFCRG